MADREFIIDLILRARDEMAATLAKATGEIAAYDEAVKRSQDAQGRSIQQNKELTQAIKTRTQSEERLNNFLKQNGLTQASQVRQLQDLKSAHQDLAKAQQQTDPIVEAAALAKAKKARDDLITSIAKEDNLNKGIATVRVNQLEKELRLQGQVNASVQSRIETEKAVADAVKTLDTETERSRTASMKRLDQLDAKEAADRRTRRKVEAAEIVAQRKAEAARNIARQKAEAEAVKAINREAENVRIQRAREVDQKLTQGARAEQAERVRLAREGHAAIEAEQKVLAQRAEEFGRLTSRAQRPAQVLARTNVNQTEEIRATKELATLRQLLIQRGHDQFLVDSELHSIRQEALSDYGHANQASRDAARVAHDEADAYKLVERAARDLNSARKVAGRTGRPISHELENVGTTNVGQPQGGVSQGFLGTLQQVRKEFANLDTSTSGFTTHLRGALGFTAVILIQPLIALVVGLVAAFASLASAAVAAAGAVGAIFLSAIAQGIPVLGIFAISLQRLGAVFNFVNAGLQQQRQRFIAHYETMAQNRLGINQVAIAQHNLSDVLFSAQQATRNVTFAQHGYSNALFGLAVAQKNVQVSELSLNQTRQQATRQLQDLIFQETQARLAAEASTLAVSHSQKALAQAIATGGDVQGAQLQLASAQAQHTQAVSSAQRAITDASSGSLARQGITQQVSQANLAVEQARHAVVNAQDAVAQAASGLIAARRAEVDAQFQIAQARAAIIQARQAAAGYNIGTAAQLEYLRSQMSRTELSLARSVTRVLNLFRGAHAFMRPITDAILGAFIPLANRIYKIFTDPRIFAAFKLLATTIGGAIRDATKSLTDPQALNGFINLVRAASQNIGPLARIIVDLIRGAGSIANAAIPFVHAFLVTVSGFADKFAAWAASTRGQNWLKNFFDVAFRSLRAFIGLGLSIGRLILDIIGTGGGAQSGINVLKILQKWVDSTARSIETHGKVFKELHALWRIAVPTVEILGRVLGAAGDAFLKLATSRQGQQSLKDLGDLIVKVVIPAFVQFVQEVGFAARIILNFLDSHPRLEKFLVTALATAAALSVAGKALGLLFGPLAAIVNTVIKAGQLLTILKEIGIFSGLAEEGMVAAFLAPLGPIALVVAAIVGLALVTGNIKQLGRTVAAPFVAAWKQIQKPLNDLGKQFLYFINGILGPFGGHVRSLRQLFHNVFGGILSVVKVILVQIGSVFGATIGGILKTISGMFEIIGGILHGNFSKVLDGFKKIGQGIWTGITAGIGDIGKKIFNLFFNGVWSVLGKIEKLGEKIIEAIIRGVKKAPGKIADAIGGLLPDLPHIGLPHFGQIGGPVPGGYGGGDRIPYRLESGEHIFTKEEVRAAGGHGGIFAIRRALGGGGQSVGRGYAVGGAIADLGTQGPNRTTQGVTGQYGSVLANIQAFIQKFENDWSDLWDKINNNTNKQLDEQFGHFHNFFDKLTGAFGNWWDKTNKTASDQLNTLLDHFRWAYKKIDTDTFNAFWYINHAANVSLQAFGAKPSNVHLGSLPKFAGGGWVGGQGERGRDAVPAVLGRGEAVLNWAHQALVEPAMRAFYGFGLDKMFSRVGGEHAGGAFGMAAGGRAGGSGGLIANLYGRPSNITGQLRALIAQVEKFWPQLIVTATTNGSHASGSYHYKGEAVDMASGSMDYMRKAAQWVSSSGMYKSLAEGIHNPNLSVKFGRQVAPSYWGASTWANHANHLHLAIAGILGQIVGRGAAGAAGTIRRPHELGGGVLANLLNAASGKTTDAANAFVSSKDTGPGIHGGALVGQNWKGAWVQVMAQIAKRFHWSLPDWRWLVNAESSGVPSISNPSSGAFGLGQFLGSTAQAYAKFGALSRDPVKQIEAMAQYLLDRYHNPTVAKAFHLAHNWYAKGGFAGGARPIIGHIGEWVVNKAQQSKIANWLGTSRGALKGALGFTGGPDSFKNGGEIQGGHWTSATVQPDTGSTIGQHGEFTPPEIIRLTPGFTTASIAAYNRAQRLVASSLERNGKTLDKGIKTFLANYNKVAGDGGLFALAAQAVDDFVSRQGTAISLLAAGVRIINGRLRYGRAQTSVEAARSALASTDRDIDRLQGLRREEANALAAINQQIRKLGRPRTAAGKKELAQLTGARQEMINRIDDADSKLAQQLSDRYQRQVDLFNAEVAKAARPSAIAAGWAQMVQTIANTFGNQQAIQGADQGVLGAARAQQAALQDAYNKASAKAAKDPRWQQTADDLLGQLEAAAVSVAQAQVQALTDAITSQDTRTQIGTSWLDFLGRISQVQAGYGNQTGALSSQIAISRGRSGFLQSQIGNYQGLLAQAQSIGDVTAVNELTQKIQDLTAQVAEANLQTQQLITAYRQVAVTILSAVTQVRGSLISSASSIIQTLGQISGSLNLPQQIAILRDAATFLVTEGRAAVQNIIATINDPNGPFGANQGQANSFLGQAMAAFNQGPTAFATWLATNAGALSGFEAGLPPDQQSLFQGLLQALIDNTTSQVDNTQQLQLLNATTNQQQFTSSAWQMFRQAIFTGLGGLLPTYAMQIPSMDVGGVLQSSGLLYGHRDEVMLPARVAKGAVGTGDTKVELYVTNPTEVADPIYLGNTIAWNLAHNPNSR